MVNHRWQTGSESEIRKTRVSAEGEKPKTLRLTINSCDPLYLLVSLPQGDKSAQIENIMNYAKVIFINIGAFPDVDKERSW